MSELLFRNQSAAALGDLDATATIVPITIGVGDTPRSRRMGLGVLRDWMNANLGTNAATASTVARRDANADIAFRDASLRRLVLRGDTSGLATIQVPAVAGTPTFTLPAGVGSAGQFLQTNGAGVLSWATAAGGALSVATYGVSGASSIAPSVGVWGAVPLNTEISDAGNIGTLASNQVTLGAGTYLVLAVAQGAVETSTLLPGGALRGRLWNVTDSVALGHGGAYGFTVGVDNEGPGPYAIPYTRVVNAVFTLTGTKAIQLQLQADFSLSALTVGVGDGGGALASNIMTILKLA